MAFRFYGGGSADVAANLSGAPTSSVAFTVWTARTGGSQPSLKDSAGTTITTVTPLSSGVDIGTIVFQADADGYDYLWLDRQDGSRRVRVELRDPDPAASKSFLGWQVPTALNDYTALQAAATAAASAGTRLVASGTITTSSTLTINSEADLAGLTINYSGATGTAVIVGASATPLRTKRVLRLPRVYNTSKAATGWTAVAGSIGVQVINLYSCKVEIPYVTGFETGLQVTGASTQGTSYTDFQIGQLDNNKRNLQLTADSTGWVNENFFGGIGRLTHNSSEGTQVAGTVQILISNPTNTINGNRFKLSVESPDVVEYHVDCSGQYNYFDCRWENTGGTTHRRVIWRNNAKGNYINYGFNAGQITETKDATAYPALTDNDVFHRYYGGNTTTALMHLENIVSSSAPIMRTTAAGAILNGDDPNVKWTSQLTAIDYSAKQANDSFARSKWDFAQGRMYYGDGTAAPSTKYLGQFGVAIAWDGANLYVGTDNTYDIGAASSNRPRYIRAGSAIVTRANTTAGRVAASSAGAGGFMYDTTLNKPIFSDGTNWRDATGTIV